MDAWTEIAEDIRVRRSRAYAMNTLVLLSPGRAVLVDAGVLPSELDDLAGAVRGRAVALAISHDHWDHVLGRAWWPDAPVAAHAGLGAALRRNAEAIFREASACVEQNGETWTRLFEPFEATHPLAGDEEIALGPWRLVARESPGHCDTQVTFHLEERRLLFAGDMLSDRETPWLDRGPAAYHATLRGLEALVAGGGVEILVPGHGTIAFGRDEALARVRRDLAYLDALVAGVRASRAAGLGLEQAQERLAAMAYVGKGGEMDPVHRDNVRFAWEAEPR